MSSTVRHSGHVTRVGASSEIARVFWQFWQITRWGISVLEIQSLLQIPAADDDNDSNGQQTRDAQAQEQAGDEAFPFELETEPDGEAAEEGQDQGDGQPDGVGGVDEA